MSTRLSADQVLDVEKLSAWYGAKQVLFDVDLTVDAGQIVALIGHNGAGKTSLARAIVNKGIRVRGTCTLASDVGRGVAPVSLVPQGIGTFPTLTVRENILLGAVAVGLGPHGDETAARLDAVLDIFPALQAKLNSRAGDLSGGQRQMVAISRALMGRPLCLVADEPSVGLAPKVVHEIMDVLAQLAAQGAGILLIEQNMREALRVAGDVAVMKSGAVIHRESATTFRQRTSMWEFF